MNPLFLITNDDGLQAKGIQTLISVARRIGDVIVMAPERNSSGLAHSFTSSRPIRVNPVSQEEGCQVFVCDGTPVDCIKVSSEHFCPRRPDLVLSGINHGSNSSINVLYSGTMGAVLEASVSGLDAIGFSLLDFRPDADFSLAGEETLPCECQKHDGKPMTSLRVGFTAPSLAATLKAIPSEKVCFRFIDASHACIILPAPQPDMEEITMILMPMILSDNE